MAERETAIKKETVEDYPATVRVIERRNAAGQLVEPGSIGIKYRKLVWAESFTLDPVGHGVVGG